MHTLKNISNKIYNVALYIRLSKEDEKIGESESIINQRSLLTRYVNENNYNLFDIYIDDGFSGTNFDRPEFKRMLKDIELGKINMVITKDMSRLGRDYIGTGEFIEKYFPAHNVRYIALTDNIDTYLDIANNDIAPFKAIMNDYYAKDISKKIRTSLRTKQKDGKWVGGCPPFGYMTDPNNKNHLVLNEEEAPIVKKIFCLALSGMSTYAIKEYLIENKIKTPSMLRGPRGNISTQSINGIWSAKTIKGIITNPLYTGDLVQNKRSKISYKIKKTVYNSKDEWIVVENTHEQLINKADFNEIQKNICRISNRPVKGQKRLLDGLLYCYECNHKITICQPRKSDNKTYLVCNYYRMNSKRKVCTSHSFNYDYLEIEILNIIKNLFKQNLNIDSLSSKITPKCKKDDLKEDMINNLMIMKNEVERKLNTLDKIYIEKVEGKITEEMYNRVNSSLGEEINNKKKEIVEMENKISNSLHKKFTYEECKNKIINFIDVEKPTREMILKLINKIEIHNNKHIDIYFNFGEPNFLLSSL